MGQFIIKILSWALSIAVGLAVYDAITKKEQVSTAVPKTPPATASADAASSAKEQKLKVGDTFRTDLLEIQVSKSFATEQIGDDGLATRPSEGARYVAVLYNYKNIGAKPLTFAHKPRFKLISPDGTKYNQDIQGTIAYVLNKELDEKAVSDLNPGVRVYGAVVFEVGSEQFSFNTWNVYVDADKTATLKF